MKCERCGHYFFNKVICLCSPYIYQVDDYHLSDEWIEKYGTCKISLAKEIARDIYDSNPVYTEEFSLTIFMRHAGEEDMSTFEVIAKSDVRFQVNLKEKD